MTLRTNSPKTGRKPLVIAGIILGILLPSGLLGFLSLRSFRYEFQLLEKQTQDRYSSLADLTAQQVDKYFQDILSPVTEIAAGPEFQSWNVPAFSTRLLDRKLLNGIPIKNSFVFDQDEKMVFPRVNEPNVTPRDVELPLDWGLFAAEIQRLERLEFEKKEIKDAIVGYEALRRKSMPPPLKASLLRSLAAAYRKLGETSKAESLYLEIIDTYEDVLDPRGQPMGITARQLLARLYEDEKQFKRADDVWLDIAQKLILNRWAVPLTIKQKFIQEISSRFDSSERSGPANHLRWERLKKTDQDIKALEKGAVRFEELVWSKLVQNMRSQGSLERQNILGMEDREGLSNQEDLLVTVPIREEGGKRHGTLAVLLDGKPIWASLHRSLGKMSVSAGLVVRLIPAAESKTGPSLTPLFKKQINTIQPPHLLEFSGPVTTTEEALFRRRVKIFALMVGLSLLVAVAGSIILAAAIRREIQLADMKSEFVANVSHELRTPLYAISHIGERLELGRYRSQAEVKEFYSMLREETQRLRELVENVLDFSKIMGGRAKYEKSARDLWEIAREAQRLFEAKALAHGFQITLPAPSGPMPVWVDKNALVQAAINLLDNALKYSGASRKISMSVARRGQDVVLSVQDWGIGIPASQQDRIFERFYRVKGGEDQAAESGVGLGLAIVKHILENHGGTVALQSTPGQGSVFSLHLKYYGGV